MPAPVSVQRIRGLGRTLEHPWRPVTFPASNRQSHSMVQNGQLSQLRKNRQFFRVWICWACEPSDSPAGRPHSDSYQVPWLSLVGSSPFFAALLVFEWKWSGRFVRTRMLVETWDHVAAYREST